MSKDKWLRVRLDDEQDKKLAQYALIRGVSRSDLIREIIDSLPMQPNDQKIEFNSKLKLPETPEVNTMQITDNLGNRFLLTVDYRPNFKLWRVVIQKLELFNFVTLVAQADLVRESESKDGEIWLNYIALSKSEEFRGTDNILWNAIQNLIFQQKWSKLYGQITLEQIEKEPRRVSWLKQNNFSIESQSNQENLYFCKTF